MGKQSETDFLTHPVLTFCCDAEESVWEGGEISAGV